MRVVRVEIGSGAGTEREPVGRTLLPIGPLGDQPVQVLHHAREGAEHGLGVIGEDQEPWVMQIDVRPYVVQELGHVGLRRGADGVAIGVAGREGQPTAHGVKENPAVAGGGVLIDLMKDDGFPAR